MDRKPSWSDRIKESTSTLAETTDSAAATANSTTTPRKWHIDLEPAPERYAWHAPTSRHPPVPSEVQSSSCDNNAAPKYQSDDGVYPPRKDSLGKQAALRVTPLLFGDADSSGSDYSVEEDGIVQMNMGTTDGCGSSKPPIVEGGVFEESAFDRNAETAKLRSISSSAKGSTASTVYLSTDSDDSNGKYFRYRGRSKSQGTDKTRSGRSARGSMTLMSRVEEFLKSNAKFTDRTWLKKRPRRNRVVSVALGRSVTLREFLTEPVSDPEHTRDPSIPRHAKRRLRRTQSFSDLRHNVKSGGTYCGNEDCIPTAGILSSEEHLQSSTSNTTHPKNLDDSSQSQPAAIRTQWDILDSSAPMDIKGIDGTDSTERLEIGPISPKPWKLSRVLPRTTRSNDGIESAQRLCR